MPSEKSKSNKNSLIVVAVVAVVAAAAFYGGMMYQKTQAISASGQFASRGEGRFGQLTGGARTGGNRGFGGAVVGEIVSVDNDSLTIKLQDGSSKIVNLSGTTTFSKTETGSKTDLKAGTKVAAIGSTNSDGSITAQNVQINPAFRMMMGGRPTSTQAK